MDALLDVEDALARAVYDAVADLLNLEVDLLFFDTTSTYFELDEPDAPLPRDQRGRVLDPETGAGEPTEAAGFRSYGRSKDSRDDLPQVVVGMAVTRSGIPVRVWCWPGAGPMPLPLATLRQTAVFMGGSRPPDVGLGLLTRWCPASLIDAAIATCDT